MPSGRTLIIVGVISVIIIAAAVALSLFGAKDHAGNGTQLAANNSPPVQGQPAPAGLARMQLEAQYAGPLRDTVIQRWRDPLDGTICYLYLPVIVQHAPGPNNLVQYGANTIGSISCLRGGR